MLGGIEGKAPPIISAFYKAPKVEGEASDTSNQLTISEVQLNTVPEPESPRRTRTPSHFANIFSIVF